MKNTETLIHLPARLLRGVLAAALLGALTGCPAKPAVVYVNSPAPSAPVSPPVVASAPLVVTTGLIYYPDYEVYYDPGVRVYWYMDGGHWVNGPRPGGISVDVLLHAPSAHMDFHDSPEAHHAQVVQKYPRGGPSPRDGRSPR